MKSPRITASGTTFYAVSQYEDRFIFKEAGWRWSVPTRQWITSDLAQANALKHLFDDRATALAAAKVAEQSGKMAASRATDANIEIPVPAGLAYLPFQRAGIAFALGRSSTLIADEMGLGKTVQALGVINASPEIRKTLIVCPASLKINWQREAEKWLVRPAKIAIVKAGKDFPDADAEIVIINYDLLKKHHAAIHAMSWDLLICDESHALKNPKAARSAEIVGNREMPELLVQKKLFLTGTPILNRPAELWTTLNYFKAETNWRGFHTRYCGGYQTKYGWDTSGATHLPELENMLRTTVMVRRLKEDVLRDLPSKIRNVIPLEPSKKAAKIIEAQKNRHAEAMAAEQKAAELKALGAPEGSMELEEAKMLLRSRDAAFEEISRMRHELGVEKAPLVADFAAEELESIPNMLIFAHHHDVIDTISKGLREKGISVVTLTGKEDAAQRQSAVDRFQAGKEQVLIGSIEAAGVGLTLTRASRVLFAESSWTPTKLQQAEDRAHRIGQVDTVFVSHLVFDNSLDGKMLGMIIDKMNIADLALDGSRKTQDPSPVAPDFSGEQNAAEEVVSMPREETRYERRLREAAANPDGMYVLENPVPSLESHGTAFMIERTSRDGTSYLFVAAVYPESGETTRIKDQDEQDKILAAIVADKQSATRYSQMKVELTTATESIPDGYYAIDGTGQNSVDFFCVSRGPKGVKVDRYVGGTGAMAMPSLASQVSAAKSIAVDPKASATRFACELGFCFSCCRPLTNDESRKEGIGPDCREKHQWFKPATAPSLDLPYAAAPLNRRGLCV